MDVTFMITETDNTVKAAGMENILRHLGAP